MTRIRSVRALASLALGLVVLLMLEIPALAYPDSPAAPVESDAQLTPTAPGAWVSPISPAEIRRSAVRVNAAADKAKDKKEETPSKYVPTKEEGAVFTIAGAGLICAGGIFLGLGLAEFFPVVTDASGLVTAAVNPLTMVGVGLTFMFTGVGFLVHGVKTLKVVKMNEDAANAAAERWKDPAAGLRSTPRQTVRPVPLFVF